MFPSEKPLSSINATQAMARRINVVVSSVAPGSGGGERHHLTFFIGRIDVLSHALIDTERRRVRVTILAIDTSADQNRVWGNRQ